MVMISWRDLRGKCKVCGERADFAVEYTNDDLPEGYLKDGTREEDFCLAHTPKEVMESRQALTEEAQRPF